jgi:nucleoside-diphosphate-sugar epimerase
MATFESYGKIRPSIVDGSVNLMLAAIDEGVKNFVYGGSMLVYNDQRRTINQETGPGPRSGYGRAKFEAEHKMAEMAERAGINFSSVRLPHLYGAKSLLFHKIRQGSIYFPGRGDNVFAHLHVSDAARALIRAAESGKRGVCVVADNLPCTWNEFFAMVQSYYPKLRVVHFPERLALMATGALDILLKYRNAPNQYTLDSVVSWNMSLPVESGTLPNVLGLDPEYPSIADGIPAVLDDCLCFTWCHSNFDH